MKTLKDVIYEHIDSKWLHDNLDVDLIIKALEEYNKQIEKNIPSDEEIKKNILYPKSTGQYQLGKNIGFISGAKWMRKKITGK